MTDITSRVKKVIMEHLDVEESKIVPTANFTDDLGADSLDLAEMLMKFEEEFGCEIPTDVQEKLVSVQAAIDYLEANAATA